MSTISPHSIKPIGLPDAEQVRHPSQPAQTAKPTRVDAATVVDVGPELPSPEAAQTAGERLAEKLAAEPQGALRAISNLDLNRINRLLLED